MLLATRLGQLGSQARNLSVLLRDDLAPLRNRLRRKAIRHHPAASLNACHALPSMIAVLSGATMKLTASQKAMMPSAVRYMIT